MLSSAIALLLLGLPVAAWLRIDVSDPSFPPRPSSVTAADLLVYRTVLVHAARSVPLGLASPPPHSNGTLPEETLASLQDHLIVLVSAATGAPTDLGAPAPRALEAPAVRAMQWRNAFSGPQRLPELHLPPQLSFTRLADGYPSRRPVSAVLTFSLPGYAADLVAVHVDIYRCGPVPDSGGGGILFLLQRRGATWHVLRQSPTWIS